MNNNKNYREEWTAIVNKTKYVLNEEQANLIKSAIARNNNGKILFPEFTINMAYLEEFYLSNKIYDKSTLLPHKTHQEPSLEEAKRVQEKIEKFKKEFFAKHKVKQPLTPEEVNTRRNKLLDQAGKEDY